MGYLNNDLLPFIKQLFVQLGINSFRNKTNLQAIIEGINYSTPGFNQDVIDLRSEDYVMGFADRYLLFDPKNYAYANNILGIPEDKLTLVKDYHDQDEVAVLLDTPHNQLELSHALEQNYRQLYIRFLLDQLPVETLPSKDYFAKVLKYIYQHPALTPEDYQTVAPFLGLDYENVLFILRVFFELGFVELNEGKLVGVKNPEKKPLSQSKYLLATKSQIDFVQKLRTLPTKQLLDYIDNFIK